MGSTEGRFGRDNPVTIQTIEAFSRLMHYRCLVVGLEISVNSTRGVAGQRDNSKSVGYRRIARLTAAYCNRMKLSVIPAI